MDTLYRKIQKGKSVRYEAVQPEPDGSAPLTDQTVTTITFTDRECLTVAASLGIVLLDLAQHNMQPHQLVARRVKAVEDAVKDLFSGTGEALRVDIAEGVMRCWDETMQRISTEGIDDSLIRGRA